MWTMSAEEFKRLYPNVKVRVENQRDGSTVYRATKGSVVLCNAFDFDGENDPYRELHNQFVAKRSG